MLISGRLSGHDFTTANDLFDCAVSIPTQNSLDWTASGTDETEVQYSPVYKYLA